jgi:hypothetical protein
MAVHEVTDEFVAMTKAGDHPPARSARNSRP